MRRTRTDAIKRHPQTEVMMNTRIILMLMVTLAGNDWTFGDRDQPQRLKLKSHRVPSPAMSLGHPSAGSRVARAAALGVALLGCHLAKETLAWVGISSPKGACSIFVSHCGPYSRPLVRMLRRAQGRDPFTVLGVEASATRDEVKKAFRERIRKAHPDAGGSTEEFKQVREAYQEALTRVGFHVSGDDSRTGDGTTRTNAPGWSIRDFYKWRREQVQQEKHVWEQDAEARSQHWWCPGEGSEGSGFTGIGSD
eukprot:s1995_g4.t1